ncbi:MAG: hypothetical protein CFE38_06195 [Comamonadaceae bacterium PBBC1]|nr:MAG: hypothetical protein CFE38_06195 [Comamonadaceae bacterium PBBC1]
MMSLLSKLPALNVLAAMAFKPIKYFIDSTVRDKVLPVPGSVLYCDLWLGAEHSGIHVAQGQISNIVVDGVAQSSVSLSDARDFTSKSTLGRQIYVSCNSDGAVGHNAVAQHAASQLGERAFYGLVIKNCHEFSKNCVNVLTHDADVSLLDSVMDWVGPNETWELTLGMLKATARQKLGATKWRLWNWEQDQSGQQAKSAPPPVPDWDAIQSVCEHMPLIPENMQQLRQQLRQAQAYEEEVADENLPEPIRQRLQAYRQTLTAVDATYEKAKDFLAACPGAAFSHADLQHSQEDFSALARELADNAHILDLVQKMGRQHISEEVKRRSRIPQASRSEVHGTHRSDDVMRMLPSELLNLEDDTLETLFYARLLEKSLQTYELSGSTWAQGETSEAKQLRTGPVVACLDTSASMQGEPMRKAKALLLAIAGILKKEDRSLHVVLFGASGEIRTFDMDAHNDSAGLLAFLQQGFGGGTDFETPLQHALDTIDAQPSYLKADVLMVSDGDCALSDAFTARLQAEKQRLECRVYSVLCAGRRVADTFSDEVVVL